jgi:hypothetical protein
MLFIFSDSENIVLVKPTAIQRKYCQEKSGNIVKKAMQKIWSRKYAKMRNIVKIKGNIPYLRMS